MVRIPKYLFIAGGVSIFFAMLVAFIDISSSEFTVYPVQCNGWIKNPPTTAGFLNCQEAKALDRQTFSVDVSKNEVVQTSPDTSGIFKLNYCFIQDGQHWSCGAGDLFKMPGGMLASTQISRSADRFSEYGLTSVIFVTKSQWNSINKGRSSICGSKWCH